MATGGQRSVPQRRHHRDPPRSGGGPTRDAPISDIGGDAACHRRDSGAAVWLKPADAERDPITIGIWLGNYTRGSGEVFGRVPGLGRCVVHSRRRVNPGPDGPSPVVGEGPGRWPRAAATTRCPPNCSPPQSVCKSAAPAAARFRGRGDQPLPQDALSKQPGPPRLVSDAGLGSWPRRGDRLPRRGDQRRVRLQRLHLLPVRPGD